MAVLDEPAHLLTAWVLLLVTGLLWRRLAAWALVGAVAIDLDHVPLYWGWEDIAPDGGRPFTHSLATVGVLVAAAAVPKLRAAGLGLAVGVLLHLVRDLGTGPGVPLWWPFSGESVTVPYEVYAAGLSLAALLAATAALRRRRISDR